jgi:electron transfer flavoprotein beta subunit
MALSAGEFAVKIAVCIKRVPVMEVKFAIAASGTAVDEAGLKYDVNDFDLWAVEAALQLKEKAGAGEVVVISVGPDAAQEQIRKTLAMGADRGVLLKTDALPADGLAIARALTAELQGGGYDLVLFGKMAIDSSNAMTGVMVAELLGLPVVTNVSKLEITGAQGTAHRTLEGAIEVVRFPLPAVLTVDEGLNKERLPSLKGIMAAKKKPLEVKTPVFGAAHVSVRTLALPPERAAGRIVGEGSAAVPALVGLLQTDAKVL